MTRQPTLLLLTRTFLVGALAFVSSALYANDQEWEQRLRLQLGEAELLGHEQYAFTQTVIGAEETKIAAFDPKQVPKWRLLSIDERAATQKEQDDFVEQQQKEAKRREGEKFEDLIKANSVRITQTDEQRVVVSFTPYLKDLSDDAETFMQGEAIFDAQDQRLLQLKIFSLEAFSPSLAVKIERFAMTFDFSAQQGQTLPDKYLFAFQGKVAAVKKIDVQSTISYSQYRRIDMK